MYNLVGLRSKGLRVLEHLLEYFLVIIFKKFCKPLGELDSFW